MKKKLMLICSLLHMVPMHGVHLPAKKDQSQPSIEKMVKNDVQEVQRDQPQSKLTNDQIFYCTVAGLALIGLVAAMTVAMLSYSNTYSGSKADK